MLRLLLAGALGALLFASSPLSAQTTPDVIGGRTRGTWDLPTTDHAGRARGVLFSLGEVVVALDARLTPLPDKLAATGGRIDGVLLRKTDTGFGPEPIAEVHGTYLIGLDGQGRFEAAIVKPVVPGVRPEPIGKIEGAFADPMVGDKDPVGRYAGRWALRT